MNHESLFSLTLYPGSVYAYCPACRNTCQPEEFISSDHVIHLVCPRCVAKAPQLDKRGRLSIVSDDDDDEWVRTMMADTPAGLQSMSMCAMESCRTWTVHSCRVCGEPCCVPHQGEDDLCASCDDFNRAYGPYFREGVTH